MSRCDNGLAGSARKVNLSGGTRHLINSRPTMEEPFVVSRESYLPRLALSASNFRTHGFRLHDIRKRNTEGNAFHRVIPLYFFIALLLHLFDIFRRKDDEKVRNRRDMK